MSRPNEIEREIDPDATPLPDPKPTDDRDERLGEAIEEFLARAETGVVPDPEEFASAYPDLQDDLKAALEGLAMVQGLVGSSANGTNAQLEAGRRVAGYRIVRELGRGGMGVVYEAVHVDLDRPVALKVLGMHAAPDSTGRRRFLNEAKTAAGLHHTHIVPVFDVGQVGGLCYYAMQRIEGSGLDRVIKALRKGRSTAAGSSSGKAKANPSLSTAVPPTIDLLAGSALADPTKSWFSTASARKVGGTVPPDELVNDLPPFDPPRGSEYYRWVARLGHQAADALAHAHSRDVIHRDIKPSNLLVDAKGTVWVADFGLARRLSDPSVTQTESLVGTPRYMSPEQAVQGPIGPLTDVYSLGSTLYELLTLRPPHDGKTTAELITQIRDKEPSALRKFDPKLPRDLETIVLKAMGKRPSDRYASADELAEDLTRFLAMEPVRARRISPVGRVWRFARRHPSLAAVTTIAATSILATSTVAYWRVVQEKNRAVVSFNRETKALAQLKTALMQNLWREASSARQMRAPDVRRFGIDRLREAVALNPDPPMKSKLRDEAVQLLALRDIEPRPVIESGLTRRLLFAGSANDMITLSDDGSSLDVWDTNQNKRKAHYALSESAADDPREMNRVRFPWMRMGPEGLSAGGNTIAVARPRGDGVRLFDLESGQFHDIPMPGPKVTNVLISSDAARLVTVHDLRQVPKSGGGPNGARPQDGQRPPTEFYRISLWDPKASESPIATLTLPEAKADNGAPRFGSRPPLVAISPDGKTVATTLRADTVISLWDSKDGTKKGELTADGLVSSMAMGADGSLVAACNGGVSRWDVGKQKPLPGLSPHQLVLNTLRFSPDGSMLAVTGSFNGIEIWDPEANELIASVPTTGPVGDIAFGTDGRSLAATVFGERPIADSAKPGDGRPELTSSTHIWAMVEPIGRSRLTGPETKLGHRLSNMSFGPGGILAATFFNSETASARIQCPHGGMTSREKLQSLALGFDPAGRLIVPTATSFEFYADPRDAHPEFTIPLPDTQQGRERESGPRGNPRNENGGSERIAPDVPIVWTGTSSADGRTQAFFRRGDILLLRFPEGSARPTLESVRPASSSADRKFDESAGAGNHGRGSRKDGPPPPPGSAPPKAGGGNNGMGFRGFGNPISLALSPNGDRIYSFSVVGDHLEPRSWSINGNLAIEGGWSSSFPKASKIVPSPDGQTVAIGHLSGAITIMSAQDGHLLTEIRPITENDGVTALAISRSGQMAVGYRSGGIRLWDLNEKGEVRPIVALPTQPSGVKSLLFSQEGRRLAIGDEQGVDIWDLEQVLRRLQEIGLGW